MMASSSRVERLVRAYVLVDTSPRTEHDPRVRRLQAAIDRVRAQLTADEAWAFSASLQTYWRERKEWRFR